MQFPLPGAFVPAFQLPVLHVQRPPPFLAPVIPQLQDHQVGHDQLHCLEQWQRQQKQCPPTEVSVEKRRRLSGTKGRIYQQKVCPLKVKSQSSTHLSGLV